MSRLVIDINNRFGDPTAWQNKQLWTPPDVRSQLAYMLIGGVASSVAGCADAVANTLPSTLTNALAKGHAGVDVYGHSVAAQALCDFIRRYTPAGLGVDPTKVRILLAANPEHRFNGLVNANEYGGPGFPLTTDWKVWDMCREYDCVADFPTNRAAGTLAMKNMDVSLFGLRVPWGGGISVPMGPSFTKIHIAYTKTPYFDPGGAHSGYSTWNDPAHPNLTYIWSWTYPLPYISSSVKSAARNQDKADRATVDSYYTTTPVPRPLPSYNTLLTAETW